MPVQTKITTTDGRVLQGISYRMASYSPPLPSVPASPYPFNGGTYHVQTALGWVDINESQVGSVSVSLLAHS
jgi:hypothetical protein